MHLAFGKTSFDAADLEENLAAIVTAIKRNKPTGAKGIYFKNAFLTSTMGPSLRISMDSLLSLAKEDKDDTGEITVQQCEKALSRCKQLNLTTF